LPVIPNRSNAIKKAYCPKRFYRQRHKIENFFCRVKDWRRIATTSSLEISSPPPPLSTVLDQAVSPHPNKRPTQTKGLQLKYLWREAGPRLDFVDIERMNVHIFEVMSILRQAYCSSKYLYCGKRTMRKKLAALDRLWTERRASSSRWRSARWSEVRPVSSTNDSRCME
jgi:hypothetical protein